MFLENCILLIFTLDNQNNENERLLITLKNCKKSDIFKYGIFYNSLKYLNVSLNKCAKELFSKSVNLN